jgi:hypothetical protein
LVKNRVSRVLVVQFWSDVCPSGRLLSAKAMCLANRSNPDYYLIKYMRTPKFNFIPERQLNAKTEPQMFSVTITKHNTITFSRSDVEIYELDGKYIRLFADTEKKVIGWSVLDGKVELDALNDARQLKAVKGSGIIVIGARKLIQATGIEMKESKRLVVKKYASPLQKDIIYYVELNDKEVKETE